MPIIIDGHNLIPRIPGLSLQSVNDETQLIEMLQEYCRKSRKKIEVFFDNAPPGTPRARTYTNLTARFIREGMTADHAIRGKLKRLGREARNWTVVSSDHEVQSAARAARATVVSSDDFARRLLQTLAGSPVEGENPERPLSEEELDDWLTLFGEEGENKE
jgi:predicted RNA-binding protein with PIN domain